MGALAAVVVKETPKRLAALFVVALTGVLLAVGIVVQALAGVVGAVVYAALLLGLVVAGRRAVRRRSQAAARAAAGRTCTCCSGTVHDPVQVV